MNRTGFLAVVAVSVLLLLLFIKTIGWDNYRYTATADLDAHVDSYVRLMRTILDTTEIYGLDEETRENAVIDALQTLSEQGGGLSFGTKSGEFAVGRHNGENIVYLFRQQHSGTEPPQPVPWDVEEAEPMRRALMGINSSDEVLDYRGVEVLAAYRFLPELELGIVAKMDVSDVYAPAWELFWIYAAGFGVWIIGLFIVYDRYVRPSEQRLSTASARLDTLFDSVPSGLFELDDKGNYTFVNDRLSQMMELPSHDSVGAALLSQLPDDERNKAEESWGSALKKRSMWRSTISLEKADGQRVETQWEAHPLYSDAGKFIGHVGIVTDVSELTLQNQKLRTTNQSLRHVQSTARIGTWRLDLSTGYLTWSEEMFRMFSIFEADFDHTMRSFYESIHPDDRDDVRKAVEEAIASEGFYDCEHQIILPHGHTTTVRQRAKVEFGANNESAALVGTVQDISDYKAVESALTDAKTVADENEARLRAIFDANTEGLIVIDDTGIIEDFNERCEELFGYTANEVIGKNVSVLMPIDQARQHDQYIGNYLRTGQAKIIGTGRVLSALRKDQTEFPINLKIGEITIEGRRSFLGAVTDLTRVQELERQLRRSQKMDAVGQLSGGIAHDFNNLLGIVVGNLDLLKETTEDQKVLDRVDKCRRAAMRGKDLTGRLLSFARTKSATSGSYSVNAIVEGLLELIERSVTARIDVKLELGEDIWPIDVNRSEFEDAIINLSINSRDAMPNGGSLTIATQNVASEDIAQLTGASLSKGDYVKVDVRDTGSGIPPEALERVFEPFFSTKDDKKGTGLGLAMVYGFVNRADGHVSISSEVGAGTQVSLYLRRADNALIPPPQEIEVNSVQENLTADPSANKVLVVEDEQEIREFVCTVLSTRGFDVQSATSGDEAAEILAENNDFHILISDIVMPGTIDGVRLAEWTLANHPTIEILLITGSPARGGESKSDRLAKFRVLRKPFGKDELLQSVNMILNNGSKSPEETTVEIETV